MAALLSALAEPLALFWLALVATALWRALRRDLRGALVAALFATLLFALGGTQIPLRLTAQLERPYAGVDPARLPQADAVVMLGGQLRLSSHDLLGFEVQDATDRFITAAELVRQGQARALVLGGGPHGRGGQGPHEGELLSRWLTTWGLTHTPVHLLGACRNTRDEAERTRLLMQQYGWTHLILVTSASHMKRSVAVFQRLGIPVTPVACDFRALAYFEDPDPYVPLPRLEMLDHLRVYLHEALGWWVYRWRGWV